MSDLRVTVEDGVCVAALQNSANHNALGSDAMTALLETFADVDANPDIRVLILTGEGKAFSAGADIRLLDGIESMASSRAYIERIRDVYLALEQVGKPTIAAVNGYALGGGLELCLACDLVIASEQASFATPEVRLGAIPGYAAVRLQAVVGRNRAAELMLLGDRIGADEAERIGLVNRVVEHDGLLPEALSVAGRLVRGAPLAQRAIKATLRGSSIGLDMTLFTSTASGILVTRDAREGVRAFVHKEEPTFNGS